MIPYSMHLMPQYLAVRLFFETLILTLLLILIPIRFTCGERKKSQNIITKIVAPIVIPKASSGSCTLFFLDWRIDVASSIIASSLDLDDFLLSWGKGCSVDRLFPRILSSSSEGFSVWSHCSLSSLRWSIS